MEDKSKPLRNMINRAKDLKNTYLKNDERIIPITDPESETLNKNEEVNEDMNEENELQADNSNDELSANETIMQSEIESLTLKLYDTEKERDELRDKLVRTIAEFENMRKRNLKEKEEMLTYANERLLFKMLEVLDDINAAVDAAQKTPDMDALLKGLEMIAQKASKQFDDFGVKPMEVNQGDDFDVNLHDAMMHIPSDIPDGKVYQVLQPGYMMYDKVLRHARVITSAGKE